MNSSCQSPLQKRLLGSTPLFSYHRPHPPQAPSQQCFSSRRSTRTTKPTPALGPSTSASKSSRPAARGTRAQKPAAPKAASRRSGGRPSWPWLTSQATFTAYPESRPTQRPVFCGGLSGRWSGRSMPGNCSSTRLRLRWRRWRRTRTTRPIWPMTTRRGRRRRRRRRKRRRRERLFFPFSFFLLLCLFFSLEEGFFFHVM
ncbi:hypothetical protein FN846DRAFT_952826 [Sphaerosporella brunnea]|uniref:Uncharacterized protein n=1 Tax=Sphaerosporella brunnea TaxID=1250544 RepID=A0A5J5EV94_9PEZI|nr:hypothetical protein FN846DRAFT_952826 [Sphaerosporella brunnea]